MYQTYQSEACKEKNEEKLIPKEVVCKPEKALECERKNGFLAGLNNDDILILGLLLILLMEDCKDNMLIIILVALLLMNE